MAGTSNKVLYIDNITTYDYVDMYRKDHECVHPDFSKFTYVVFTEYTRESNKGITYHGDIFFNGQKITYVNDVDTDSVITDGKDNIIGYVTDDGGLGFAKSTIDIDDFGNTYELFNVSNRNDDLTYEYISNLGDYTIETPGTWSYEIVGDTTNISVENGHIRCSSLSKSVELHLAYSFTIGKNQIPRTTYAYYCIYNNDNPTSVKFSSYTPNNFTYGAIFTPIMDIEPYSASQCSLKFEVSNSNILELINTKTGTFRCKKPGTATLNCSYTDGSVSYNITVSKVFPNLSLTAFGKNHLESGTSTNCYAHYDSPFSSPSFSWFKDNTNIGGTDKTKSPSINSGGKIKFTLNNDFTDGFNSAVIQIYGSGNSNGPTETETLEIIDYSTNGNMAKFVVKAVAKDGGSHYVDTNYNFMNSIGLTGFTPYKIETSGKTTFTYVNALIENNQFNEIFAQYTAAYNNAHGIENSTITCYNIINVYTTDSSFLSYTYKIPYTVDISIYNNLN